MIVHNGYVSLVRLGGESGPVPCQWRRLSQDRLSSSGSGSACDAESVGVLVEEPDGLPEAGALRIVGLDGSEVGTYPVASREVLHEVGLVMYRA